MVHDKTNLPPENNDLFLRGVIHSRLQIKGEENSADFGGKVVRRSRRKSSLSVPFPGPPHIPPRGDGKGGKTAIFQREPTAGEKPPYYGSKHMFICELREKSQEKVVGTKCCRRHALITTKMYFVPPRNEGSSFAISHSPGQMRTTEEHEIRASRTVSMEAREIIKSN